jgi:hypothetical protein
MSSVAPARTLVFCMLVLLVCDVVGGFLARSSGADTWNEAWGFDTDSTVPLPVGVVQLVLAWLAARNVRPPTGFVAAVILSAFSLASLIFGSFDGDLTHNVTSDGWISARVLWGFVLLAITGFVGLLAAARARQLRRPEVTP